MLIDFIGIPNLKISSWTEKQEDAWISSLPDVKKPSDEGFDASILDSVVYLERKKEWDEQYGILALLTLSHYAPVERLKRPGIVRIKLGERADLLCRDVYRSLQYKPADTLSAGRSRYRPHVSVIGGVAG
jgi:hypothetical protein